MTPADKSGSTGQNTERDADRASVASDGQATPVEQPAGGKHEGNGSSSGKSGKSGNSSGDEPTARVATSDDLELSHGTPPPWQRVPNDTASSTTKPTTAPPSSPPAPPPSPPAASSLPAPPSPPAQHGQRTTSSTPPHGESTVSIERPVVTGAAAARLFADGLPPPTMPAPGTGMPPGGAAPHPPMSPTRTTVHLEGSGPSTGPLRVGAAATPSALRRPGRGPRRANLQIKRFDPWSVLKLSLVLSVALFFVWLVAVGALYAVLDGMGVWDKLNGISSEILQPTDEGGGEPLISAGRVFGVAAIIGAVNIVLFSALATVGAFIYNVSADLAGGLEVTLAERE